MAFIGKTSSCLQATVSGCTLTLEIKIIGPQIFRSSSLLANSLPGQTPGYYFVTNVAPILRAWAAISVSLGPIGFPVRCSSALNFPYSIAALSSKYSTDTCRLKSSTFFRFAVRFLDFSTPNINSARVIDEIVSF